MSAYYQQLIAAGATPEEAARSCAMNEVQRITNWERYACQQQPPSDYERMLRDGYDLKYGLAQEAG